jgi:ATP-dependent DNA ligase
MDTRAWAHELKHDGYRLQIHVRDGRVRLYTINGANWSDRYPLIARDAARFEGSAIIDPEVVWIDPDGVADFDALHSRVNDGSAVACAFDLMAFNGDDLRRKPFAARKPALGKSRSVPIAGYGAAGLTLGNALLSQSEPTAP